MAGVKGSGGPPPKRDSQRRHRGELALGKEADKAPGAEHVIVPEPDPNWHPMVLEWFASLEPSGQSRFYEPSDWSLAVLLGEVMSRELGEQAIVVGKGEHARIEYVKQPVNGAVLTTVLKGMGSLMVTEGDRRRMRLELIRPQPDAGDGEGGSVTHIDDAARRLRGGAG